MSVKQVKFEDTPFAAKKDRKLEVFARDILEVIANKIEYSEFIELPYSVTTANKDLDYKARKICREHFYAKYGKAPSSCDFFKFSKEKDDKGIYHWFLWFNVGLYNQTVNLITKE